jgi:hypothetical protein
MNIVQENEIEFNTFEAKRERILSLQGKGKRMTKRDSECMKNKQNRMK